MIWEWILILITNTLVFFISQFPDMTVQDIENISKFKQTFGTFRDMIAWANWWFPVDTLFICLYTIISIWFIILTVVVAARILTWVTFGRFVY